MFGPHEPLRIETVTLADPGPREVRISLKSSGVCHSDLNYLHGVAQHYLPVVLGHEGFGTVVEVGEEVTRVQVGDTVMPFLVPECGVCELCMSGLTNRCQELDFNFMNLGNSPISLKGLGVGNLLNTATFAEQTVVNEDYVVKVNPDADPMLACCLACGVTTGLGAALNTAAVRSGSSVVVFGAGGVGLGAVQGARVAGAKTIIVVDTNPAKEAVARRLGATHFLDASSTELVDQVRSLTGRGAEYAFECVGRPELYPVAADLLDRGLGGLLVGVGVLPPSQTVTLTPAQLSGVTITRSFMGGAKRADVATYVDWLVAGKIDLQDVVSHRLPLDEINRGIELITTGKAVRVVIDFSS